MVLCGFGDNSGGLTCSTATSYCVDWRVLGFVSLPTMLPLSADGSAPSSLGERGMGSPLRQQWHTWLVSIRASKVLLNRGGVGVFFCRFFFFFEALSGSLGLVVLSSSCLLA